MTVREFIDRHQEIKGMVIASLTDTYIVDSWPEMQGSTLEGREDKILELRIFNEKEEHLLFRTDTGKDFTARMLKDTPDGIKLFVNGEEKDSAKDWESFDEEQYLDIDAQRSRNLPEHEYYTTGGGRYCLPLANVPDAKVKIRYYLSRYEKTGQARIADWRVVDFTEGK